MGKITCRTMACGPAGKSCRGFARADDNRCMCSAADAPQPGLMRARARNSGFGAPTTSTHCEQKGIKRILLGTSPAIQWAHGNRFIVKNNSICSKQGFDLIEEFT